MEIMAIFQRLNRERGLTVVFVTHEAEIAQHTRRVVQIRDGLIVADEPLPDHEWRNAERNLALELAREREPATPGRPVGVAAPETEPPS
jgi:ABC-type lipoprotein export system ATPase subunit